ncbi:MAG: uroporphyrinogen-III synthase [Acidiferrobacterales bacterium]
MAPPRESVLRNVHVLVTRPEDQQQNLVELIESEGGEAIRFPTIEIAPTEQQQKLHDTLQHLDQFNIAVFISPNAAQFVFNTLSELGLHLPDSLLLACVGKGCARAVEEQGYMLHAMPVSGIGSEGLLQHELMQLVEGKRVVIFRGNGGRELLADSLRERGAEVEYCECYRRKMPDIDTTPLVKQWRNGEVQVVTITSTQALKNLRSMIGDDAGHLLQDTPLVALSERIAEVATELGCKEVLVTGDTSDIAIVDAIKQWRMKQNSL